MKHSIQPVRSLTGWRCLEPSCAGSETGAPPTGKFSVPIRARHGSFNGVKLFYTGPVINAEMLVVMLEKHGIIASQEFVDPALPDDGDLSRPANVLVPEADYARAHRLFYAEREDEL